MDEDKLVLPIGANPTGVMELDVAELFNAMQVLQQKLAIFPLNLTGMAGRTLVVKADESGLEFLP